MQPVAAERPVFFSPDRWFIDKARLLLNGAAQSGQSKVIWSFSQGKLSF